jgi:hypothetical protein
MMRRSYRRQAAAEESAIGHSLFGSTGWLFADLLLALAVVFLVATTVGTAPLPTPKKHPAASTTHKVTQAKKPNTGKRQPPPLDLDFYNITFTINDPSGLIAGSPSAVAAVRASIVGATRRWDNRSAGIVLLYGGDESGLDYKQLDDAVTKILQDLGKTEPLFRVAKYRDFLDQSAASYFSMDIYLFSRTT